MTKAPHTGKMLKQFVRKNRLFQSGWARQQGVYPTTIARYLKNPTMRVDTLFTICQVLQYNFFREVADLLPDQFPPVKTDDTKKEKETLQQEITSLKQQVATLEKALLLVGGKGTHNT
jgi:hypothetical protein